MARGRCAERLADADLARPVLDGNQHDVHHADASERERHQPDDAEERSPSPEIMRSKNIVCSEVSQTLMASRSSGFECLAAREDLADLPLQRPVDVLDPARARR